MTFARKIWKVQKLHFSYSAILLGPGRAEISNESSKISWGTLTCLHSNKPRGTTRQASLFCYLSAWVVAIKPSLSMLLTPHFTLVYSSMQPLATGLAKIWFKQLYIYIYSNPIDIGHCSSRCHSPPRLRPTNLIPTHTSKMHRDQPLPYLHRVTSPTYRKNRSRFSHGFSYPTPAMVFLWKITGEPRSGAVEEMLPVQKCPNHRWKHIKPASWLANQRHYTRPQKEDMWNEHMYR